MKTKRTLATLGALLLVTLMIKQLITTAPSPSSLSPANQKEQPSETTASSLPQSVPNTSSPANTAPTTPPHPGEETPTKPSTNSFSQPPDKGSLVHLLLKNNTLTLSSTTNIQSTGFRSKPILPEKNGIYYRALSQDGTLIVEATEPDPTSIHHDYIQENGKLAGGNIQIPEASLALRIPNLPENSTLEIYRIDSPTKTPLHSSSKLLISLKINQLTK